MNIKESTPVWEAVKLPRFPRLSQSQHFDVVVIGGGMTGLSTALFFKESGKRVCVLERNRIGQGETGHTTVHLTYVTDVRLKQLVRRFGQEQAALARYAGRSALELIEQFVTNYDIDCKFHRTSGYLHASLDGQEDESDDLRAEAGLARELGFDADFVTSAPIVEKPAVRLRNQAKFHPAKYLAGLARAIDGGGCAIFEESEVSEIESDPLIIRANDCRIACDYVVLATHVPLMGKTGLLKASIFQTKLAAYSSYVVGGTLAHGIDPDVSLWDTSDPYYYLRVDAGDESDRVIFGGKDHKTGQELDTEARYTQLEDMVQRLLPSVKLDHRWSGQVIATPDGLPYIGESSPGQFVATGFNGNGITFGTLAGMMARDAMLGRENPWQDLFSVDRKPIRSGMWDYFRENLDYPYYLIADWVKRPPADRTPRSIRRGEGEIVKLDGERVACARDSDGTLHRVSAVCTHLGCIVHWNKAEQTWDCPCHGSRFLPDGSVIAGPAETSLLPFEPARKAAVASKAQG